MTRPQPYPPKPAAEHIANTYPVFEPPGWASDHVATPRLAEIGVMRTS